LTQGQCSVARKGFCVYCIAVNTEFSIAARWSEGFNETGLRNWVEGLRSQLSAPVTLGLVFMSPDFFPHAAATLEILRVHGRIPLLAGCSGAGLIVGEEEMETATGLVLALYSLPGAQLKGVRFTQSQVEEATGGTYWHLETGIEPSNTNGWLVFHDPFHMDAESWMRTWNEAYAPLPTFGGAASGIFSEQTTQTYLNGDVFEDGGIAISVGGDVKLAGVVSQGCTPIGEPWTLTRVEQNLIHQIANRPAYTVLAETFQKLPPADQQKARGNLLIGLVVNEYLEDFHRGDFLVRQLIGGDPNSGILAVGALPRAGQTMQFQRTARARQKRFGRCARLRRLHLLLQWPRKKSFRCGQPRCRLDPKAARPAHPGRLFLQRGNRPRGREKFPARLYRRACAVCEAVNLSAVTNFFHSRHVSLLHLPVIPPLYWKDARGTSAGIQSTGAEETFITSPTRSSWRSWT
jgi:small ligand-binding sensory domain FIST